MTLSTTAKAHEKLNVLIDASQAACRSIGTQFERGQPFPQEYVTAILGALIQSLEANLYFIKQSLNNAYYPTLVNEYLAMLEQATAGVQDVGKNVRARFQQPQNRKNGAT